MFFICLFFVCLSRFSHIGMIEKPTITISANYFYWRTAANICGRRDVIGWGGEDPKVCLWSFPLLRKTFPNRYLGNGAS
jgi:hypothetical protein